MRILSIGNFGRGWDGSICDEEHIAQALENLGHEVVRWQREQSEDPFQPGEYDFILLAQWDKYELNFLHYLKDTYGAPIIYWAFDYQADGQPWHEALIRESDLYLSKRFADKKYLNWHWLPQDFAPEFLYSRPFEDRDIDVLFTGSWLPWATERTELLKAIDKRFNLKVHSFTPEAWKAEGLKNVGGPVMDEELPELIAKAKVNISIDHTLEAGYWSDRNAQIMACGGMVLFRYVPMSEIVFGDKIAYFYSTEDCLEKIQYYLEDEFAREQLAGEGFTHANNTLMVTDRVQQLLAIVRSHL